MNKNNLISKVFQGGEGITDLTIKNKLNVIGSVSLPADSIQIEDIKDLQTTLNTTATKLTSVEWDSDYSYLNLNDNVHIYGDLKLGTLNDVEFSITDLTTKTTTNITDITTINTNLSNYALKTDVPTTTTLSTYATKTEVASTYATKTDVSSTYATKTALDTNVSEVSTLKTKTADITKDGVSTKIPNLWVTDVLYLTDPDDSSQNIDIGDTINYLKREVNTTKTKAQTNATDITSINDNLSSLLLILLYKLNGYN